MNNSQQQHNQYTKRDEVLTRNHQVKANAIKQAQAPYVAYDNVFDLHVFKQCVQYHLVPDSIRELIFSSLSFEECLDAVANRVVHAYRESDGATIAVDEMQAEINEQIIEMMQFRFDRSVGEIEMIVGDLCEFKVEQGEYNRHCPMLTETYGTGTYN